MINCPFCENSTDFMIENDYSLICSDCDFNLGSIETIYLSAKNEYEKSALYRYLNAEEYHIVLRDDHNSQGLICFKHEKTVSRDLLEEFIEKYLFFFEIYNFGLEDILKSSDFFGSSGDDVHFAISFDSGVDDKDFFINNINDIMNCLFKNIKHTE